MRQALREAFSDARGKISRRAVGFYFLLGLLGAVVIVNLCNNKNVLSPNLEQHLFELLGVAIASIFGDGLVNKQKSSVTPPPAPPPPGA